MMKVYILCFFTILTTGCQGPQLIDRIADSEPTTSATEKTLSSTFNHDIFIQHCQIDSNLQDGSYIATGKTKITSHNITPTILSDNNADLWDTLGRSFTIPVPKDRRVEYYKRWYLDNPHHITTVTARAEPFLYYIFQQVIQRDMPTELALLPFVESSFDQFAYSNRGAAGLWQFTVATGRAFGLEYLKGYDGRRDIIASTEAALDLLEYLYNKFDGNWLHAIAAYNTGEGRVRKAIKHNKSNGQPTDFWSLKLPKETRLYVPKLLAMADLVKHQEIHNLNLAFIKPEPVLTQVVINHRVKLQLIAQHAGLSGKELYGLNPGYTSGYTFRDRDNTLLIPKRNRQTLYENKNSSGYVKHKFIVHRIRPGDSLTELAYLNNTTVSLIKNANNLSDSIIFAGQPLLIPVHEPIAQ